MTIHEGPAPEHPADAARTQVAHGGRTMAAGRALIVIVVALATWVVLFAPTLERASEAQPLGTRRTVSLWLLRPIAAVSDFVRITAVTEAASRVLGRDPDAAPGGSLDVPLPDDLPPVDPSRSPAPTEPVVEDTKIRRPTPTDELRIAVVGDSLAAGLGVYLEREFRPALVQVLRQGRVSTGLSRLDYFDWMSAMRRISEDYRPDLVVVMIGDNDNQSLLAPNEDVVAEIGSFEWPQGYEDRVEQFTRIAVDGGSHVAWVGLPIVQRKERWPVMQRQNDIFERVIDATPNALYVDTWDRFASGEGQYTPFYWEDGKVELVRTGDGLHFNPRGYELLAEAVGEAVVERFRLPAYTLAG
ncbi:MAG TPA: GDSL-type esterase/lipase family protein [Actinomycetota bacterium]|nr:GDSL-type esterase/lipase family protein [Actinomycetota bacterium]